LYKRRKCVHFSFISLHIFLRVNIQGYKGTFNNLHIGNSHLTRLPDEMLLAVLEEAKASDLISLSRTCTSLRYTAILVYLRCTGILRLDGSHHKVCLVGRLPADAISALCTSRVCRRFSLDCDLINVIQYGQRLRHLCTRSVQIPEFRVFLSKDGSLLENSPSILTSLSALLTSMTDCHCSSFLVEKRMGIRSLSALQFPKMSCYIGLHQGIRGFAASLHSLELSAAFFEVSCRWFLEFSMSPSITSLSIWGDALTEIPAHNLYTFLSHLTLPHLEYLLIHPTVPFHVIMKVLSHHPQLRFVDLGRDHPYSPLTSPSGLTAPHGPTGLPCITSLTISSIFVALLFKNFPIPCLEILDIWVGIGALDTLDTALEAIALHIRLDSLILKVRFCDDITKCCQRLNLSVSFRGLKELEIYIREGLCEQTTIVSIFLQCISQSRHSRVII
jgi:hypothetical protein